MVSLRELSRANISRHSASFAAQTRLYSPGLPCAEHARSPYHIERRNLYSIAGRQESVFAFYIVLFACSFSLESS